MITTIDTKREQLAHGYYQSGSGPQEILILGSCRTIPYLNYLVRWNNAEGNNQFTIRRIDPCDWVVENIDVNSFENDERILSVLKSSTIFIHEHLESYGMFNTSKHHSKSVYLFGMTAPVDISIPNWHDWFLLFNDYADCGVVAPIDYVKKGEQAVAEFCEICKLSSFPEMADHFANNWRTTRFFWSPNHVSSAFSLYIFRLMNDKFLHLPLVDEFWREAEKEDLFKNPHTEVTSRDREEYGIKW